MLFLSILTLFIGAMDTWMGAAIRFGGKVGLLNNFYADERHGKLDRAYARRAGTVLLAGGLACLGAGAASLWLRPAWVAALLALAAIVGSLAAYRVHYARSVIRLNPPADTQASG